MALGVGLVAGSATGSPTEARQTVGSAAVRVDQLGFRRSEKKVAYLMLDVADPGLAFTVVNRGGDIVLTGRAAASKGSWSGAYQVVYPLDLSRLHRTGTYRIRVDDVSARSPWFRVASAAKLLLPRVNDAVAFFRAQRDGTQVIPGPLHRKPSHLNDSHASLYAWPRYTSPGSDTIVGRTLHRLRGPVDLEGGWFDAGDYIKFAHTAAYTESLLLLAQRESRSHPPSSLIRETRFGLRWLRKTWDPKHDALYIQVGIGSGNRAGTFYGDHDSWRLPESDDSVKGSKNRYLQRRPVFATHARKGHLAPNLAGRVSAAFALAAQNDARSNPRRARAELHDAAQIFSRAKTSGVTKADVVTALPHAFYPESSWRDDMELGAAELARAGFRLHDHRAQGWLRSAAFWARSYLSEEAGSDTLNVYDVSAIGHAELVGLSGGHASSPVVRRAARRALADLRSQLSRGMTHANHDAFLGGGKADEFDVASHTFGLVATAELYGRATGSHRFDDFGTSQRNWVLGGNAWGTSMMIGVGTTYPACPQHVVANLSGNLNGRGNVLRGGVVNGPNSKRLFSGGLDGFFDNGNACPVNGVDRYAEFTGQGSRFVDDVRAWQTVEPALDFTATAALAFALQGAHQHHGPH